MTSIKVTQSLGSLRRDLTKAAATVERGGPAAVRKQVRQAEAYAKRLARAKAGPHGSAFHKRITGEMTDPRRGEVGPEGSPKTAFLGVGDRSGAGYDDLDQVASRHGERLQKAVNDLLGRAL